MIDSLPAVVASIHDDTEAIIGDSKVGGKFWHHVNENVRGKFFVFCLEVRDALNMFLRDNQNVYWSFGRQILERDNAIVLVNFLRGDFARRNLAKIQSDILKPPFGRELGK